MLHDTALALAQIVGRENVLEDQNQLEAYGRIVLVIDPAKPSFATFLPQLVVRPSNSLEVTRIVKFANEHVMPIYVSSGGTEISGGSSPVKGGILIDMRRMNRIIAFDGNSMCVTVEAACRLSDLEETLASHGMRVGHMPLSIELGATVAGSAETYGIGAECSGYETLADRVIGMEVVLASGEILDIKPTLKSSMGHKTLLWLFLGTEGAHGIITKLTLSAKPFDPARRKKYLIGFPSFESAVRTSYAIYRAGVSSSMTFAMNRSRALWCLPSLDSDVAVGGTLALAFDVVTETASADIERFVMNLASQEGGERLADEFVHEFYQNLYAKMNVTGAGILSGNIGSATPSFTNCESSLRWYLDSVQICRDYGVEILGAAHLGPRYGFVSIAHGSFEDGSEEARIRNLKCRYALIKRALELGGCAESSHGVGLKNAYFLKDDLGITGLKMLQQLKRTLDPKGVLNPGKAWSATD